MYTKQGAHTFEIFLSALTLCLRQNDSMTSAHLDAVWMGLQSSTQMEHTWKLEKSEQPKVNNFCLETGRRCLSVKLLTGGPCLAVSKIWSDETTN